MESTGVYWIPLFQILEGREFGSVSGQRGKLSSCRTRNMKKETHHLSEALGLW